MDDLYQLRKEVDEVKAQLAHLTIQHNSLLEVKSEIEQIQKHAEKALQSLHEALA